ncbi:hypothetical protein [Modestobacter excelsi]|uniref:hypothetical protein n=1 Tax=Modestobacter excelsi TaxID=2213161 RepID=UPI00110D15A0|nr:hypothetical protein [Modestobacter excelsi]
MARDLVIARVGRNSLHRAWIDEGKPRGWDLYLCPFQEIPPQTGVDCTVGEVIPGPKWTGLRTLLNEWDGWRDYDNIWLPDDDILTNQDTISAMFEAAAALQFKLFTPSLQENSHYGHYIIMRNRNFFARRVSFVEIMVPGFSRPVLEQLLHTLDLSTFGWGWGLEPVWAKLLDYEDLGILDAVPVLHTRPVGKLRDADLHRRMSEENDQILAAHDAPLQMVTFAGIGPDLKDMALTPDELLVRLVQGWDYLFAENPGLLRWIVGHQAPFFSWPDYPVLGTPASPPAWPGLGKR